MTELRDRIQAVLGAAYQVERELGSGGMSRVFVALETALGRRVVVKVLPPQLALAIAAERFRREIQMAASLQHPHIVPLLAAGGAGDVFYYTMPLVEGESLRTRLARERKLPVREAVRALRDVADALAYAHARGIVHRDIKPDNVLLSDGHAVVTDFGVAEALSQAREDAALTSVGLAIGTPAYMAPEQAAGDPDVDARADIYALGATGYEMLAGRPPFADRAPHRMLAAHAIEPVTPVALHRPDVPPALADLVMRCLEKEPERRPASAAQIRDALDAMNSSGQAAAPAVRRRSRRPALVAGLVAAGVLMAWLALRSSPASALDENRVAVAPFDVLDPGLMLWREGLVDVLSRTLDGAGPLRTVSPTVVVRRWRGRADAVSAQALGRETGARTVVFGGLVGAGPDSVRLSATVFDVARGTTMAEIELRDRADRMDRISDSLAVRVLREIDRTRPIGLVRGTALGSTSLPALKAFLAGEQFLRRSQWDSAIVYDRRAIALDSGFALAWSHAGLAAGWAHSAGDTFSLAYKLRAGSLNHGLAPRESLIVQAESLAATVYGSSDQLGARRWGYGRRMIGTLQEAVRRYPTDPELWYMLGDGDFHAGLLAHVGQEQSLEAFDHSIALDSAFTPSYVHAIQLAFELRGPASARHYATEYLRAGATGAYAAATELILRLLDPQAARSAATMRLLDTIPMAALHLAEHSIIEWADSTETGLWLALRARDRLLHDARTPDDSSLADRMALVALAFRGHLQEARLLTTGGYPMFAQFALLGAIPRDSVDLVLRSWLKWKPGMRPWWALPWWADHRDTASIASLGRAADLGLRAPPVPLSPSDREIVGYVSQSARAYLALARGDTSAALRQFENLPDSACLGQCELDALVRIRLLVARGRDRDAARRLDSTPVLDGGWWAVSPTRMLWELERARVSERLGDRTVARTSYAFVAEAWLHADAILSPYVEEARAGLMRLGTDRKS